MVHANSPLMERVVKANLLMLMEGPTAQGGKFPGISENFREFQNFRLYRGCFGGGGVMLMLCCDFF